MTNADKIQQLRQLMKSKKIDAWIAPSADTHQSEYVAEHWKSREWLSGFTGSAGTLVITKDMAGLWTDSRYFIQAAKELDGTGIKLFRMGMPDVPDYLSWLKDMLPSDSTVGFDGGLLSVIEYESLKNKLDEKNISLYYLSDLIDDIWENRPSIPLGKIIEVGIDTVGENRIDKLDRVIKKLNVYGANSHLIAALDDIAWLFNIRGTDIEYNPVVICFAYISQNKNILFIKKEKIKQEIVKNLESDGIEIRDYDDICLFLKDLPLNEKILLDPGKISIKLKNMIPLFCNIIQHSNFISSIKAMKNNVEIKGFKNAHIRDGVAMVKWMYWLKNNLETEQHTEITIAEKLEEFRAKGEKFHGLSFNTIAGYKENGAIVHYSAKPDSAAKIDADGLLLVDSGAQYLDGTTDITRTISLGNIKQEEKEAFTSVLRGHINLAKSIFPKGYTGAMIDTFSRAPLWEIGYNYSHGTGHGVGHFLSVHEGPQQIRPTNNEIIELGMVTSNEPGMYLEGKFGIRIENLIVTVKKIENEIGTFYGFDTITLCPIDLNLVIPENLSKAEKKWLNDYHEKVYNSLKPFLTDVEEKWLKNETRKI